MKNPKVSILECQSGKYMVYSTNDALGKILLSEGVHELPVQQVSEFILKTTNRKTILDVGANIGSYSIPLANKFSEKNFYCFELQRNIYYQLCGNIFLNSLDNIHAFNLGVSSIEEDVLIPKIDYSKCWNVGGYSIDNVALSVNRSDFPNSSIIGNEPAKLVTLNKFNSEIGDIGLIKLDVEGHELNAIRGSLELLKSNGYPPIIFECWGFEWFAESKNELFQYLVDIGYSIISNDIGFSNFLAQSESSNHHRYIIENRTIRIGNF